MAEREITGKHVLIGFVAAFGVIIGVNMVLAVSAVKTFPGLEVKNSYVASQEFDKRRAAQESLGWAVTAELEGEELVLSITDKSGQPVELSGLMAVLGRPTHVKEDREPAFRFNGQAYVAPMQLEDGNWDLRMEATAADGTEFRQRIKLHVKK
ncbi:FixH family protein [Marimonas arenosa]|uniref:FixH family protein n=1 Tax=Marimonas arenosa TaxID=1795305 RepID=A0AAE4B3V2_9RHOB|nr:FixH family protein [Marimonas arenosa]MDQ2089587.1 FixH family protein [Marimonas arenosa]